MKTEFVATASHELRSPLTSIKGFVELLSRSDGLDEKQREFLDVILLSTNRLVDLVNDLLDVARIEAGQFEIHRRPTDAVEAVREVATLIEPRIKDKAQELDLELPRVLPPALADPGAATPDRHQPDHQRPPVHAAARAHRRAARGRGARHRHERLRHGARDDAGGAGAHLRPLLPRRGRAHRPRHGPRPIGRQVAGGPARRHDHRRERARQGLAVHREDPAPAAARGRAAAARGAAWTQGARRGRRARHRRADRGEPRALRGRDDDRALGRRGARPSEARALRRDDPRHPDAGHERVRRARGGARRPGDAAHVDRLRVGLLGAGGARGRVDGPEADRRRGADGLARVGRARRAHAGAGRGPRVGQAAARAVARSARARPRLGVERRQRRADVPGAPLRGRARGRRHAQPPDRSIRARPARPPAAARGAPLHNRAGARRASSPRSAPIPCRSRRRPRPCCRS